MHGISEAEIRAIERARDAALLPRGNEFWRAQVERVQPTGHLDDYVPVALERLLHLVDPNWLRAEAQKPYRLGNQFLSCPLHLVNGVRLGTGLDAPGPQRYARMLLTCQDHISKRSDLDFFAAATFVPELAMLGTRLDEIAQLGREADRKLRSLPLMPDELVSATIYELLVGAACVRRGLQLSMLPEDRSRKVPDYRITNLGGIPAVIECKRRLGLTQYELEESKRVKELFCSIQPSLHKGGIHGIIEASFRLPLRSVGVPEFVRDMLSTISQDQDSEPTETSWGSLAFRRLEYCGNISETRLYSPDFLKRVFDWDSFQEEWDGLLCEVEAPWRIVVKRFRMPLCLKWRSESKDGLTKKARGVTSLWADAVKQIPEGEMGFIYIAYPEGSRSELADARTREILEGARESWFHRWSVRVPVTVVSRLYARSLGPGCPDLIESSLPCAAGNDEFLLTKLPHRVFTPAP
jgi:hypothetical protein